MKGSRHVSNALPRFVDARDISLLKHGSSSPVHPTKRPLLAMLLLLPAPAIPPSCVLSLLLIRWVKTRKNGLSNSGLSKPLPFSHATSVRLILLPKVSSNLILSFRSFLLDSDAAHTRSRLISPSRQPHAPCNIISCREHHA